MRVKYLTWGLFFFSYLLMSACVQQPLLVKNSATQAVCAVHCQQQYARCLRTCVDNCSHCERCALKSATKNYARYRHQQGIQGKMIARQLASYLDPLQCKKTTCNCQADYSACKQFSGARVIIHNPFLYK